MNNRGYFTPRRMGHVNLWMSSLESSQHFYNKVCGLHLDFWEPDLRAAFCGTGHFHHDVAMMEMTKGEARYRRNGFLQLPAGISYSPGLNHIAWELENKAELVGVYERLQREGILHRIRFQDERDRQSPDRTKCVYDRSRWKR